MDDKLVVQLEHNPLAIYNAAKQALTECVEIDHCKEIKNRAEAIKAYGIQAKDRTIIKMGRRIQLRAVQRMGDLILETPPKQGANQNIRVGTGPNVITRISLAKNAGLSDRQRKTAIKIAKIPEEEFERMVESENPPTLTELIKKPKTPKPKPEKPTPYDAYISVSSLMQALAESCNKYSPAMVRQVNHPLVTKSNVVPGTERDCLVVYNWIKEYLDGY